MKKAIFIAAVLCIGLSVGCKKETSSGNDVKYEKILGLELYKFGNTMIVYTGGSNTYDLTFTDDGTYTKKKWSDKSTVNGTWVKSSTEITMNEKNGPTYTLTANPEGIVKDGMSVYINGEAGSISGLFNEMIGTGSGVLDMCYTDQLGRYKVELLGDVASITININNGQLNINRNLLSGGFLEDNDYSWTCNGIDVIITKIGTSGEPQDISKIDDKWWIEGIPINLFFISDNSYVGYMVTNIDYLGE